MPVLGGSIRIRISVPLHCQTSHAKLCALELNNQRMCISSVNVFCFQLLSSLRNNAIFGCNKRQEENPDANIFETKSERFRRRLSLITINIVGFISTFGFSIVLTGAYPYLLQVTFISKLIGLQ